jgi:hypothetical protein
MRQLFVIVLIALFASAMAATNCSTLVSPTNNYYMVPDACLNTTAYKNCADTYNTCKAPHATAGTCPSQCYIQALRCLEAAASSFTTCASTWASAFNNEKLYLAAGGDYNGSALMQSCTYVVCYFLNTDGAKCASGTSNTICADPSFSQPTPVPVPADTTVAPTAAPGKVVASFKFSGTQAEWQACLEKLGKARVINEIVVPLLTYILNNTHFVVINVTPGSLQIDFYMTDDSTPDQIINKLGTATIDPNDSRISGALALAKSNGVASEIGVVAGSITAGTQAPNPGPGPTSASAVAVMAAVLAVVAAMLF